MLRKLASALGIAGAGRKPAAPDGGRQRRERRRLKLIYEPAVIYAIGDIHGCVNHLRRLEARIEADARDIAGSKMIVTLGDYVDRGPDSASVLDHLTAPPPPGLQRLCILGNHEQLMLDALLNRLDVGTWLDFGGDMTMLSYGVDFLYLTKDVGMTEAEAFAQFRRAVPGAHADFLADLPIALETPRHIFVHAGIRPQVAWKRQTDDDLLYIRRDFLEADLAGIEKTVVHGHTPGTATITQKRIGLDTGAYLGGPLTAAKITPEGVTLIEVN